MAYQRLVPDHVWVDEYEINRQEVFLPNKNKKVQSQIVSAYITVMQQEFGAVEFNSLEDLENYDQED